ncbi:Peptidoglycan O-acetyltransferase [Rubripirellula obstinata]|uniref:Peptidoglycan O-acetyltransferase n=1 Tax=Rubripirellula obstinata TaxID=406547 RepID=A0A5B1CN49_9BACT|nr:MBOAT family protein [Rubripirellula obstinata]KAA1261721.1 Peptidoglycan O-acetyltransferase [Rubripirellula obstinata]
MIFTQAEFLIFFLVVLAAVWSTKNRITRNVILLVASYYFYAYWDYRFCGLLILSTAVDFIVAKWMYRSENDAVRKSLLATSVIVNLGVLAYFKYADFFIESARQIFDNAGLGSGSLGLILPVGISFYTFQTLSYTIDVYRQKLAPTNSIIDFALYVAFFPQLVAGPIVRARELLPQLSAMPGFSRRRCYGGFQQMLRGAVKKVLLADRLGEMVDVVFAGPEIYHGATVAIAVVAYAGQIYYDFSGYSDIAIGAAKMLGYRFPVNFRHPYLATSMADFWHRWHMTLSRWLRDYLYIPLGGSRAGTWATYRNLMITMTLGGLWHGAAWTFVLWGMLHGMALAIERATVIRLPKLFRWLCVLTIVLTGWVLFRSPDFATAMSVYRQVLTMADGILWLPPLAIAAIGCLAMEHLAWRTRLRRAMRLPADRWYSPIAIAIMIWCLILYAPQGFRPFVYFQF